MALRSGRLGAELLPISRSAGLDIRCPGRGERNSRGMRVGYHGYVTQNSAYTT